MRIFVSAIVITFFLVVPELFAAANNRVVAKVNDDVITLFELNNMIEELTGKTSEELQSENEEEFFNIRKLVLERMMDDRLEKQKIKELELEASREQIDRYVENIKQERKMTQEDLIAQLEKEGMTYEKYREKIKDNLEHSNLVDREIREKMIISEEQINEYYESHKKEYEKPGEAHIAIISLTPSSSGVQDQTDELQQKGEDILERLKKGEDFGDLARKFSNGPGAEEGGDLGNITLKDTHPKILEVINSLKDGEVSSLIDMGNKFLIVKLIKKTATEWIPLEEVKDDINELLYYQEMDKRYNKYMEELKKDSYIKVVL
ncbi:MAG: SurA N-terminal domain-containing protein [Desulfobacteraceae bacterium]|jgi:peptidyl-prolyl cis-trans isomerase SurA